MKSYFDGKLIDLTIDSCDDNENIAPAIGTPAIGTPAIGTPATIKKSIFKKLDDDKGEPST